MTADEKAEPEDTEPEDAEPEDAEPEDAEPEDAEPEDAEPEDAVAESKPRDTGGAARVLAFGVLPVLALLLAIGAGVLKWYVSEARQDEVAREESLRAARDIAVVMLTYDPAQIEQQLAAAQARLTGPFKDTYAQMANDVIIPGAKEQAISAVTTVPAAALESLDSDHAVAMLYVNQKLVIGDSLPTDNLSTVRVTLDKVGEQWLLSQFQPV